MPSFKIEIQEILQRKLVIWNEFETNNCHIRTMTHLTDPSPLPTCDESIADDGSSQPAHVELLSAFASIRFEQVFALWKRAAITILISACRPRGRRRAASHL
jgi:hypothetical protein